MKNDCLFCAIAAGEIPSSKVYEDELCFAFRDINPQRISASGRGEFFPIDSADTKEARAKNRRTEIILTPKLDELFQIIDNN